MDGSPRTWPDSPCLGTLRTRGFACHPYRAKERLFKTAPPLSPALRHLLAPGHAGAGLLGPPPRELGPLGSEVS